MTHGTELDTASKSAAVSRAMELLRGAEGALTDARRDDFMMRLELAAERLAADGEPEFADAVRVALGLLVGCS